MTNSLPVAVKQANEIAEQANSLSAKLQSIADTPVEQVQVGVDPFIFAVTVFVLACFVGYYVVWKVTPALHTPLMSITNAISGIIIIGALLSSSGEVIGASTLLGLVGVFFASINIFGGFVVTERMLSMFKVKK